VSEAFGEERRAQVEVRVPDPTKQRRWTVALRLLLLVPHWFFAFVIGLATVGAAIGGWFAALVLGRLPEGIANFLTSVLRYWTRLSAYAWLLVDEYPPFSLTKRGYPVGLAVQPGPLNRASVLFRLILVIPAYIVAGLVSGGLTIAAIPIWLILLVRGRLPRTVHDAITANLRYQTRYAAYLLLLTSEYPRGLFAETLSVGGKRLTGAFLALGFGYWIALFSLGAFNGGSTSDRTRVIAASNQFANAGIAFSKQAVGCPGKPNTLACVQALEPTVIAAVDRFDARLKAIRFPPSAQADAAVLEARLQRIASIFRKLTVAATPAEYVREAKPLAVLGNQVDAATRTLIADLQ
jgi:hypothetical protein